MSVVIEQRPIEAGGILKRLHTVAPLVTAPAATAVIAFDHEVGRILIVITAPVRHQAGVVYLRLCINPHTIFKFLIVDFGEGVGIRGDGDRISEGYFREAVAALEGAVADGGHARQGELRDAAALEGIANLRHRGGKMVLGAHDGYSIVVDKLNGRKVRMLHIGHVLNCRVLVEPDGLQIREPGKSIRTEAEDRFAINRLGDGKTRDTCRISISGFFASNVASSSNLVIIPSVA